MTPHEREQLVYRIMSGEILVTIDGTSYKLLPPTQKVRAEAAAIYEDTVRKNRFDTWLTDKNIVHLLVTNKLCSADIDENIKKIDEEIENLKVRAFTTMFIPDTHSDTRRILKKVKAKREDMVTIRHAFDHLTLHGFAEMVKRQYIMYCTLHDGDGTRLWTEPEDVDSLLLEQLAVACLEKVLSIDDLRELARNDPWRGFWNMQKNPIGVKPGELTDEQRTLMMFSRMYDSVYNHPNCPPDEVVEDDDLCDGWLIKERRASEKDRMTKQFEDRMSKSKSKMSEADEVFIVAKTKEDADRINNMNDTHGRIVKAQRAAVVKKKGKAVDANFADRKIQLQNAANQQFVASVKGKK